MNTLILGLLLTFGLSVSTVIAQNDTMYVMKNGVVINKQSVKTTDVDSIIFYKPAALPVVLTVGQTYQGGKIAYILQAGDPGYDANVVHGLIAAPTDQNNTGIRWYDGDSTKIGETGKVIGTGNTNTNKIVTNQGAGSYAAKLCSDLVLDGYSDWYLPSKDELNKLYINKAVVGGYSNADYWSSTEGVYYGAWYQHFGNGYQNYFSKDVALYVRAVRAF